MNLKKLAAVAAVSFTLVLGLMIHGGRTAQAAGTFYVDGTSGNDANACTSSGAGACKTIQAAVNKASAGDTVNVAAGTYNELLSVTKALNLNGANAGIHPAVGTHPTEVVGVRGAESILSHNGLYALNPAADNIVVDGFKFTGNGGRIIDTFANANGFVLRNCIFNDNLANPPNTVGVIQFGGGSHTDMVFEFNFFQDKGSVTIYTGGGPFDRLKIQYNKFNVAGTAVFWTATPLVDGLIKGNEFDGVIAGVPGGGTDAGMNIGQGGNVVIQDNWFHDMFYTNFQIGIDGGSIINNTFERTYPLPPSFGDAFQLWGGQFGTTASTNVTITGNKIHFNDVPGALYPTHGLRLRAPDAPATPPWIDASTIHVHGNDFLNGGARSDAYAVRHQGNPATTMDGTCNWWSTNSSSAIAALMLGSVNFTPWSTSPGGPCVGSTTPPSVVFVNSVPSVGKIGTTVSLSSQANDPAGLTDIYYNLFTPGGAFVCNLAHVSVSGSPTSYTDAGTLVAAPMPFAGLDTGVGGPCPAAGIAEGSYVLAANWIDGIGNQVGAPNNQVLSNYQASATFSPFIFDKTPPSLTAPGTVTLYTGSSATSCSVTVSDLDLTLGTATATDNLTGVASIVRGGVPAGSVFPVGSTTVTYTATDGAGNTASANQTVNVVDNTAPVITLIGNNPMFVPYGSVFTDPGATALDNCAGNLTSSIVATGTVNTFVIGTYTRTYMVSDGSNPAVKTRTVKVVANPPTNKDQCKGDGWKNLTRADGSTFKNQGDCIQYANTGK